MIGAVIYNKSGGLLLSDSAPAFVSFKPLLISERFTPFNGLPTSASAVKAYEVKDGTKAYGVGIANPEVLGYKTFRILAPQKSEIVCALPSYAIDAYGVPEGSSAVTDLGPGLGVPVVRSYRGVWVDDAVLERDIAWFNTVSKETQSGSLWLLTIAGVDRDFSANNLELYASGWIHPEKVISDTYGVQFRNPEGKIKYSSSLRPPYTGKVLTPLQTTEFKLPGDRKTAGTSGHPWDMYLATSPTPVPAPAVPHSVLVSLHGYGVAVSDPQEIDRTSGGLLNQYTQVDYYQMVLPYRSALVKSGDNYYNTAVPIDVGHIRSYSRTDTNYGLAVIGGLVGAFTGGAGWAVVGIALGSTMAYVSNSYNNDITENTTYNGRNDHLVFVEPSPEPGAIFDGSGAIHFDRIYSGQLAAFVVFNHLYRIGTSSLQPGGGESGITKMGFIRNEPSVMRSDTRLFLEEFRYEGQFDIPPEERFDQLAAFIDYIGNEVLNSLVLPEYGVLIMVSPSYTSYVSPYTHFPIGDGSYPDDYVFRPWVADKRYKLYRNFYSISSGAVAHTLGNYYRDIKLASTSSPTRLGKLASLCFSAVKIHTRLSKRAADYVERVGTFGATAKKTADVLTDSSIREFYRETDDAILGHYGVLADLAASVYINKAVRYAITILTRIAYPNGGTGTIWVPNDNPDTQPVLVTEPTGQPFMFSYSDTGETREFHEQEYDVFTDNLAAFVGGRFMDMVLIPKNLKPLVYFACDAPTNPRSKAHAVIQKLDRMYAVYTYEDFGLSDLPIILHHTFYQAAEYFKHKCLAYEAGELGLSESYDEIHRALVSVAKYKIDAELLLTVITQPDGTITAEDEELYLAVKDIELPFSYGPGYLAWALGGTADLSYYTYNNDTGDYDFDANAYWQFVDDPCVYTSLASMATLSIALFDAVSESGGLETRNKFNFTAPSWIVDIDSEHDIRIRAQKFLALCSSFTKDKADTMLDNFYGPNGGFAMPFYPLTETAVFMAGIESILDSSYTEPADSALIMAIVFNRLEAERLSMSGVSITVLDLLDEIRGRISETV